MPRVCYLCKDPDASIRFPMSEPLGAQWASSLGLPNIPPSETRICTKHFSNEDFYFTQCGKRFVRQGSLPKLQLPAAGDRRGGVSEHNYSTSHRSAVDTSVMDIVMTMLQVMVLWLPFLMLFCYCLTEPMFQSPPNQHSRSRVLPVSKF